MIVIIDYGMGNLRSVQKALKTLGFSCVITKEKAQIKQASGIILPGVGAFDPAIEELRKNNLESVLLEEIAMGKPFLGICLGFQLLFSKSEEGKENGLGVFKGSSKRFPKSALQVPQMGWNRIVIKKDAPILAGISSGAMMYFAHSYYPVPDDADIIAAQTDYGVSFASVVSKDNIFGVQFHPEKSGEEGLKMLRNFGEICKKKAM